MALVKTIKFLTLLVAIVLNLVNSSFIEKRNNKNYLRFGVITKQSLWPGTWRLTVMNLDCYQLSDWECIQSWTTCTMYIDLWLATVVYDDGCVSLIDVPWQGVFGEQQGEFIYETY